MRRALALVLGLALAAAPAARASSERELGRRFLLSARGSLPLVDDPSVVDVVRRLAGRLVDTIEPQQFEYQFFVVRHPALNAFAVPGGYVFIFSGLLARADSEDELVGVLGHEIAHVHAHHMARQQAAGQVWTAASLLGVLLSVINPVLGMGAIAAAQTAQLKYSRDFEQEADFLGLRIASQAGFDPGALSGFFEHLLAEQRLNPVAVPPYMLSHPVTEDRVTSVQSIIEAQGLTVPRGRPASSLDLREAQAVVRAVDVPAAVVTAEYEKRVAEATDRTEARYLLGRVLQSIGKLEAARAELEAVAATGGMSERIDRPLGTVYLGLGEHAKARTHLGRWLGAHPQDAWARVELGKVLEAEGDDQAVSEYRRAVALDPSLAEGQRRLGLTLGRGGNETDGLYHLGHAAMLTGDLERALRHFTRVAELLAEDDRRRDEVEATIEELTPLVPQGQSGARGVLRHPRLP